MYLPIDLLPALRMQKLAIKGMARISLAVMMIMDTIRMW
jgi:hypothetical protein